MNDQSAALFAGLRHNNLAGRLMALGANVTQLARPPPNTAAPIVPPSPSFLSISTQPTLLLARELPRFPAQSVRPSTHPSIPPHPVLQRRTCRQLPSVLRALATFPTWTLVSPRNHKPALRRGCTSPGGVNHLFTFCAAPSPALAPGTSTRVRLSSSLDGSSSSLTAASPRELRVSLSSRPSHSSVVEEAVHRGLTALQIRLSSRRFPTGSEN